jgi:glucose 1-dehydrogenase
MDLRLDGKVALVTGSSKGIGKGIAEELARSGADVTITYEGDESGAEETAAVVREQGRRALIVQVDVADEGEVDRLYEEHLAEFGRLDILVNNAAIVSHGRIHEISTDEWRKVMAANLDGAFFCMARAARQMIAQGGNGRIIAISSVHEEACTDGGGPYAVSKAGLRNLVRTMAIELGEYGITVNGIAPGMTVTPGMNTAIYNDEKLREERAQLIVLKRAGYPEDIANMAVFLASDAASYCTGATYYVDGGWMLTHPPV